MPWHSVRGHDRVVDADAAAGRWSRGHCRNFLFVGTEGVGKRTFAQTLAQALLCEARPSGAEPQPVRAPAQRTSRVISDSHPDVIRVERPEDKHDLPIRLIRDLCVDLGLKPMRGTRRVAIVDDADDFNDEAANAFLKTLEEPPPGAVLILIGTSAEIQLDTIISRCRVVQFDPLPAPTCWPSSCR